MELQLCFVFLEFMQMGCREPISPLCLEPRGSKPQVDIPLCLILRNLSGRAAGQASLKPLPQKTGLGYWCSLDSELLCGLRGMCRESGESTEDKDSNYRASITRLSHSPSDYFTWTWRTLAYLILPHSGFG